MPNSSAEFSGRAALVTGSGRNIGRAIDTERDWTQYRHQPTESSCVYMY